ncbi:MAG: DUF1801 domain-containing protein [Bacteroidota bacterium]
MKKYTNVADYFADQNQWQEELQHLRNLLLETELKEGFKWNFPVYMLDNKNLIGLGTTKQHFNLWLFQGVFLADPAGVLYNAQEGKTKAMRQWRFSSTDDIKEELVIAYIEEAIQNQRDGLEMKPMRKKKKELIIPPLLQDILDNNAEVKGLFTAFSLAKQIEFAEYISGAKREATQLNRLEKVLNLIRVGEGLRNST